jgi:hypothetical protein
VVITVLFFASTLAAFLLSDLSRALNQVSNLGKSEGLGCFNFILIGTSAIGSIHALGWLWGIVAAVAMLTVFPLLCLAVRLAYLEMTRYKVPAPEKLELAAKTTLALFCIMVWLNLGLCIGQFVWGQRLF